MPRPPEAHCLTTNDWITAGFLALPAAAIVLLVLLFATIRDAQGLACPPPAAAPAQAAPAPRPIVATLAP